MFSACHLARRPEHLSSAFGASLLPVIFRLPSAGCGRVQNWRFDHHRLQEPRVCTYLAAKATDLGTRATGWAGPLRMRPNGLPSGSSARPKKLFKNTAPAQ